MKKVLITGATGFAGSHLAEYLATDSEYKIVGTCFSDSISSNVTSIKDRIQLIKVDLTKREEVNLLISETKPDQIYHLAALPSPAASFKNPTEFLNNNINAEVNLLEAIKENGTNPRILIVSSAEIYGLVGREDLPIDEDTPLRPTSPYAVSKIAQDFLGLQYFISNKMDIVRVRPFNHVGPRLSSDFAPSAFSKKIAEIEKDKREPLLTVGNLEAKRDFTDVRDMVRAYLLLMENGVAGEVYNIGSGKSVQIKEVLDVLLSFSKKHIEVKIDPELIRPNDIPELVCDFSKFKRISEWSPKIPLETSLEDTLNYWRTQV